MAKPKPGVFKPIAQRSKPIAKARAAPKVDPQFTKYQSQYLYTGNLKQMNKGMRKEFASKGMLGVLNPVAKYGNKKMDSSYKSAVTKGIREAYGGDKEAISDLRDANKHIRKAQKDIHEMAINSGAYKYTKIPHLHGKMGKGDLVDGLPTYVLINGQSVFRNDIGDHYTKKDWQKSDRRLVYRAKTPKNARIAKKYNKETNPEGTDYYPLQERYFGKDGLVDRYEAVRRDKKRDMGYKEIQQEKILEAARREKNKVITKAKNMMTKEGFKDFMTRVKDEPRVDPETFMLEAYMKK